MYETRILLSYLWYLSRHTNFKTPAWRDISALGALHNVDMIYIFIGYFWWLFSIELINIGLVHTYLCIKTHIDKFKGKNHEGPCFHYWCSVYGICKWSDTLWPVGRVRLFADYTISLSSLCKLIWKHWTTKMLVRYMMPSVCLRLRQFSQLSLYSLYGAVCLQLTQFSCDDRENVYFILLSSSNRKYESLTIV